MLRASKNRRPVPCELGMEIKSKLVETGITQRELSRILGMPAPSYLSEVIYGRKSPGKYSENIINFLTS